MALFRLSILHISLISLIRDLWEKVVIFPLVVLDSPRGASPGRRGGVIWT